MRVRVYLLRHQGVRRRNWRNGPSFLGDLHLTNMRLANMDTAPVLRLVGGKPESPETLIELFAPTLKGIPR